MIQIITKGTVEMDFFVWDKESLVPVGNKNVGFNGTFYTFPYFSAFLLKRF